MNSLWILLGLVAYTQAMIYCPPDFCDRVKCKAVSVEECDGRVDPKGTVCGCCPSCIKQLKEDEDCRATLLLGLPPQVECTDGLYCHFEKRLCKRKTCAMLHREMKAKIDKAKEQGKPLLGAELPNCLSDGTHHPKQCRGSQCFCVDSEGRETGHSVPRWMAGNMNCKQVASLVIKGHKQTECSRDLAEYQKLGIIGKLFFCEDNGNYKPIQCQGSVCFCVDEFGVQLGHIDSVGIWEKEKLKC